jgi:hypothetical protein
MDKLKLQLNKRNLIKGLGVLLLIATLILICASPREVKSTHPASGKTISFGDSNGVGTASSTVSCSATGDFDNDGDFDLVVGTYASGTELKLYENDGSPWLNDWPDHDLGDFSPDLAIWDIAVGDLDNDGVLDVITALPGTSPGVSIWKNDGTPFNGTWISHTVGTTTHSVSAVAVGDLNNDGLLDIGAGTWENEDYEIIVYRNNGNPFSTAWIANDVGATGTKQVQDLAIGDLNNDAYPDIITVDGNNEVNVWKNDKTPFLGYWTATKAGDTTANPYTLSLGDLDNDSDLDIVVGTNVAENFEVFALQNDGTPFVGAWTQRDIGTVSGQAYAVEIGDLDGDGDLDIVTGCHVNAIYEITTFQNDGDPFGDFWPNIDVGTHDDDATSLSLGDFDNDGDLDIASTHRTDGDYEVMVWENTHVHRNMPFDPQGNGVGTNNWIYQVSLADLDQDGDLDIYSGSHSNALNEVVIWQNDGGPFTGTWVSYGVGATTFSAKAVVAGDLDLDGDLDLVSGHAGSTGYQIKGWQNNGTPFSTAWTGTDFGECDNTITLAIGDLDNDGDLDLVSGNGGWEVAVWKNDGTPFNNLWFSRTVGTMNDDVNAVTVGDLDQDGLLDIVSGSLEDPGYEIIAWQNDGTPFNDNWTSQNVADTEDTVFSLNLGDLDNDGDLDLVSGSGQQDDAEVITWWNDGTPFSGIWNTNEVGSVGAASSIALGDLDGDGDLDVVSGHYQQPEAGEIFTWENDGSPFSGKWPWKDIGEVGVNVNSVALGDLDGDGDLDIASGSYPITDGEEIVVWRNKSGNAGVLPMDTSPINITDGQLKDILRVTVAHNGIQEDNDLELHQLGLDFLKPGCVSLTSAEANAIIDQVVIYQSINNTWEYTDTLVTYTDTLNLIAGKLHISFTNDDERVKIQHGTPITYFVALEMTANASSQSVTQFQVAFHTTSFTVIEDRTEHTSVSIQDAPRVDTKLIKLVPLPPTATPTTTSTATDTPTPTATATTTSEFPSTATSTSTTTPTPESTTAATPTPTATSFVTPGGYKIYLPLVVR